jgi:Domain of unknown function (DUF4136)
MLMKFARQAVLATLVLFALASAAAAQKVTTSVHQDFDFANHRRYGWRSNHVLTRQGHPNDRIIEETIVWEVNQTLKAKGFIEDEANPDFFVSCDAGAHNSKIDIEAPPSPMSPILPPSAYPGVRQNIWYSVDGAVTFYVVDARTNQDVWIAEATKKIRDPAKMMREVDEQVKQFVSKSFKSFPPSSK